MTPPSLATHWLMPRLPAFIDAHPGVDIRVFAVRSADGNADDFDITIGYGDATCGRQQARPLLEDTIRPFCAPSRLGAADLAQGTRPAIATVDSEAVTTTCHGKPGSPNGGVAFKPWAVNHLQIDPSYVAIEAAVKGVGIILESSLLTEEHVRSGRLGGTRCGAGAAGCVLLATCAAPRCPRCNSHRLQVAT